MPSQSSPPPPPDPTNNSWRCAACLLLHPFHTYLPLSFPPKVLQVPRILTVATFEEGSEGEETQEKTAQAIAVVAGSCPSTAATNYPLPPLPPPSSISGNAPIGVGGTTRRGSFAFWLVASVSRLRAGSGSGSGAGSGSGSLGQLRQMNASRATTRCPSHTMSSSNLELAAGLGQAAAAGGDSVPELELGPPPVQTASAPNLMIDLDIVTRTPSRPASTALQSVAEIKHPDEDSDSGCCSGAGGSWRDDDGQQAVQPPSSPGALSATHRKLLVMGDAHSDAGSGTSGHNSGTNVGPDSGTNTNSSCHLGSPVRPDSPFPISDASLSEHACSTTAPLPRPISSPQQPQQHFPLHRLTSLPVDGRSSSGRQLPPESMSSSAQQLARLQDAARRRRSDTMHRLPPPPLSAAGPPPLTASLSPPTSRALSQSRSRSSNFCSSSRQAGIRASPSFPRDT